MRRNFLKKGDGSTAGAEVLEGEETCTHNGTALTFIGAKVYCYACKTVGLIAAQGPRWPDFMMEKEQALEGDICICKCQPPPIMIASQNDSFQSFEHHELAALGFGESSNPLRTALSATRHFNACSSYDEQTHLVSPGVEGIPYYIETADGRAFSGCVPANGLLPRIDTQGDEPYTVLWGDEALAMQAGESA
ncbi:PAAR domain-containing protein [Ralstonia holmesii]|uniref:PAAR domain-containing protein n=1 Tax=Ralstonia TaxID=48736 RepID=UPI000468BC71|nr:PAAR domain-containing protein [Ralstonia pickettii]